MLTGGSVVIEALQEHESALPKRDLDCTGETWMNADGIYSLSRW